MLVVKNLPADAGDARDLGFNPWVRRIPWRRKWHPTPVFLPGESHGQRNLGGSVHGVAKSRIRLSTWSVVDLQRCVSFWYTAKWFSYTYVVFQILFSYRLLQDVEYSSLCYTLGPCLSVLCIVVCICESQTPDLSSSPFPFDHLKFVSVSASNGWAFSGTFRGPGPYFPSPPSILMYPTTWFLASRLVGMYLCINGV